MKWFKDWFNARFRTVYTAKELDFWAKCHKKACTTVEARIASEPCGSNPDRCHVVLTLVGKGRGWLKYVKYKAESREAFPCETLQDGTRRVNRTHAVTDVVGQMVRDALAIRHQLLHESSGFTWRFYNLVGEEVTREEFRMLQYT